MEIITVFLNLKAISYNKQSFLQSQCITTTHLSPRYFEVRDDALMTKNLAPDSVATAWKKTKEGKAHGDVSELGSLWVHRC